MEDVYCPVEGRVFEANTAMSDKPDLLGQDPYGKGWLIKVRPEEEPELDRLLSAEEYKNLIEGQEGKS